MYREHLIESLWFWTYICWVALDVFFVSPMAVLYSEVFTVRRLAAKIEEIKKVMMKSFDNASTHRDIDVVESSAPFVESVPFQEGKDLTIKENGEHLEVDAHVDHFNSIHFMFASARISQWKLKDSPVAKFIASLKSQSPSHLIFTSVSNTNTAVNKSDEGVIVYNWWFQFKQFLRMHHFTINYAMGWYNYLVPRYVRRANEELLVIAACYGFVYLNFRIYDIDMSWYIPLYGTLVGIFLIWFVSVSYAKGSKLRKIADDIKVSDEVETENHLPVNSTNAFDELIRELYNDSDDSDNSEILGSVGRDKNKLNIVAYGELSDSSNDDEGSDDSNLVPSQRLIDHTIGAQTKKKSENPKKSNDKPVTKINTAAIQRQQFQDKQLQKQSGRKTKMTRKSLGGRNSILDQLKDKRQSIKRLSEKKRMTINGLVTKNPSPRITETNRMTISSQKNLPGKKEKDNRKLEAFNDSDSEEVEPFDCSDSDDSEDYIDVVKSIQEDEESKLKTPHIAHKRFSTKSIMVATSRSTLRNIRPVYTELSRLKGNSKPINDKTSSKSKPGSQRPSSSPKNQQHSNDNSNEKKQEILVEEAKRSSAKNQRKIAPIGGRSPRGTYFASKQKHRNTIATAESKEQAEITVKKSGNTMRVSPIGNK